MRLWWLQRAAALLLWNVLHKRCVHTKLCWEAFVSHLSRVWGLVVVMHQEGFVWISRAWRIPLRHAETHIYTHTHTLGFTQSGDRGSVQSSTNRIHLWSLISSNWNFSPRLLFCVRKLKLRWYCRLLRSLLQHLLGLSMVYIWYISLQSEIQTINLHHSFVWGKTKHTHLLFFADTMMAVCMPTHHSKCAVSSRPCKMINGRPVGFNGHLGHLYQLLLPCILWQTQLASLIKWAAEQWVSTPLEFLVSTFTEQSC